MWLCQIAEADATSRRDIREGRPIIREACNGETPSPKLAVPIDGTVPDRCSRLRLIVRRKTPMLLLD
jgi:hypothetical protein